MSNTGPERTVPPAAPSGPGSRLRRLEGRWPGARAARLLTVGWVMHMKMRSRSVFDGLLQVLWPLFFAAIAFFLFRAGGGPEALVYASLGAAVMGVWSSTSTSAGNSLQRERWHGTLELLVAAPAHFALILLPVTITMATSSSAD